MCEDRKTITFKFRVREENIVLDERIELYLYVGMRVCVNELVCGRDESFSNSS
jgi:hypothetical protein